MLEQRSTTDVVENNSLESNPIRNVQGVVLSALQFYVAFAILGDIIETTETVYRLTSSQKINHVLQINDLKLLKKN